MKSIKEVFTYIKLGPFLRDFTNINPLCGIYQRVNGKATNGKGKSSVTEEEKEQMKSGVTKLYKKVIDVIDKS